MSGASWVMPPSLQGAMGLSWLQLKCIPGACHSLKNRPVALVCLFYLANFKASHTIIILLIDLLLPILIFSQALISEVCVLRLGCLPSVQEEKYAPSFCPVQCYLPVFVLSCHLQVATEKDFIDAVNKVIKAYAKFSSTPRYMTYN